jgi:hypothetical protein
MNTYKNIIPKQLNKNFYKLTPWPLRGVRFAHIHRLSRICERSKLECLGFVNLRGIIPKCINESENYELMRQKLNKSFYYVKKPLSLDEINIILKPLFKDISFELQVSELKLFVLIKNIKGEYLHNKVIIDVLNELEVHDDFRRFIIKAMSTSNKKNIYYLDDDITWICQLNVNYTF